MSLRVACVMMQRNETLCLRPWLAYHGHLFGYENLVVIDHGSNDPGVKATLLEHAEQGLKVVPLPPSASFRDKSAFMSAALRQADTTCLYDFLFPLDCDEFLMTRLPSGHLSCDKAAIFRELAALADETGPLLVKTNLLYCLNSRDGFWELPYQKVFFTGGNIGDVDDGSHTCPSRPEAPVSTNIIYAHYHHKPYAVHQRMSAEKLRPYVDVNDRERLAAWRGTNAHLVSHLLSTEDEYMALMTGGSTRFPALPALFETIGIDPAFTDPS